MGAYGIPKRHQSSSDSGRNVAGDAALWSHQLKPGDGLDLAVQVGEDAYFIRENAMGVADGVGGWSSHPYVSRIFFSFRPMHAHFQNRRKAPLLHRRCSLDA